MKVLRFIIAVLALSGIGAASARAAQGITLSAADCSLSLQKIEGNGSISGNSGDKIVSNSLQLLKDGSALTTGYSISGTGPWTFSAGSNYGGSGSFNVSAKVTLIDSNHNLNTVYSNQIMVTCN